MRILPGLSPAAVTVQSPVPSERNAWVPALIHSDIPVWKSSCQVALVRVRIAWPTESPTRENHVELSAGRVDGADIAKVVPPPPPEKLNVAKIRTPATTNRRTEAVWAEALDRA